MTDNGLPKLNPKNQTKEVIGSSNIIMINQQIGAKLQENLKKGGKRA
jgi:hypothetical protein